ncbi:hypothetical protein TNCV_4332441 [Trichonephila clavipes]|nr:hypothetical protein TNCV_4332441 [Trichonephila clavipes]
MASNSEIVTPVQEESDLVNNETDEDEDNNNDESIKGPSYADAFSALETAMECVRFLYTACIAFGFRLSELCLVPIDSDKRRSTVDAIIEAE